MFDGGGIWDAEDEDDDDDDDDDDDEDDEEEEEEEEETDNGPERDFLRVSSCFICLEFGFFINPNQLVLISWLSSECNGWLKSLKSNL